MNKEGLALLSALIDRLDSAADKLATGNCRGIAIIINTWLPADMKVTPNDVFEAVKDKPAFRRQLINLELLRDVIDKNPHLHSARISGSHQAILNELLIGTDLTGITMADVELAMALKPVPQPDKVSRGFVTLRGRAALG